MQTYALRLQPGEDLKAAMNAFAQAHHLEAACIITCVGSLRKAALRFANADQAVVLEGHFEIVSLVGTFSMHGGHYHIAISDEQGRTFGGHLMEGSEVYTTAEIILVSLDDYRFLRTFDPQTGYRELDIQLRTDQDAKQG